jgi:hypothetical protein
LLGDEHQDRKTWIERRLQELAEIFAISVVGKPCSITTRICLRG